MTSDASGSRSRLLAALDSSMLAMETSTPAQTPTRFPLHTANSSQTADPARQAILEARTKQYSQMTPSRLDTDADFLTSALSHSKRAGGPTAGGFKINYDQETPVRAIDIGGADQAQKIQEFVTNAISNISHGLSVQSAMKDLGLKHEKDAIPGLEVRLLPHQIIGVAWMLKKEESKDKGGILADDMGLGKTVEMIATMVMNMPKLNEDGPRTTLIVVPAALLQQWKEEIETKTNGVLSVHIHHGKDKLKRISQVKEYDVIITTYQTLNGDFVMPKDLDTSEEAGYLQEHGGTLARMKFYRVIADEAQYIRNRGTKASISLAHVRSIYRWMLTGTPVTNSLADIYGLLRFGRFRPWNDWNDFNSYVAKMQSEDAPLAGERARAILQPILLRRTKDSELEGQPILRLPKKDIEITTLKFSPDERELYTSFETSSKIRLNKYIREGTIMKNHAAVLVMILRLRQVCCHPYLILANTDGDGDNSEDYEKERSRAITAKGRPWVDSMKRRFMVRARAAESLELSNDEGSTCPACTEPMQPNAGRILGCGHEMCFDCLLDMRNAPAAHDGIFGEGTEKENLAVEKKFEDAAAKGYRPCPTCKEMQDVSEKKVFKSSAFEPTEEELSRTHMENRKSQKIAKKYESSDDEKDHKPFDLDADDSDDDDDFPDVADIMMRPTKKAKTESGDDDVLDLTMDDITASSSQSTNSRFLGRKPKPSPRGKRKSRDSDDEDEEPQKAKAPSEALLATWRRGDDDMEPSTKMLKLMELLNDWEASGDKTICYSQWTSMLDLIETLFARHGIRCLRFDGKMDRGARDACLKSFKSSTGPKVILISTKCGGVGLNLVVANRIVNMDLSWNYAAESQAYDRAHRIGQDKEVWVKRLVVENTIEERMLRLQDVKVGLAEAALGEGTGNKLHKLSVRDIRFLFGMNKEQAPGQTGNNPNHD
ncbi:SNF2 family N-terminal domain-containing protein [Mucidula mucida]|nr:SNF2 family N-terminal domain-containing protein [Mucidula mucida]